MNFTPLYQLPNAWTLASDRFGLHLFDGEVTVDEMDEMERLAASWHESNPGRTVELVVIEPSRHRMTGEERRRMSELMKTWEHARAASATVIVADGLLGAIHRSILTGLVMLAPPAHPAKICPNLSAALDFLRPHLDELGDTRTHAELLDGVKGQLSAFESRTTRR